jgi:pentatricopeptide repeat protein
LQQSMILFNNLKRNGMFDAVTINTLVSVAVSASSYHIAESLLLNYTEPSNVYSSDSKTFHQHPNVEAYTELIDGYGKAGKLSEAVQLLQTMRTRGVKPNEITYTSIIGALSRHRRIKQAKDMIQFMQTVDRIRPGSVTYNAMISGLLGSSASVSAGSSTRDDDYDLSPRIDTAMEIYTTMSHCGVKPNGITISTIINSLSRCQPSRFTEALQILIKAEEANVIRRSDFRVGTSMIRAYASIGDVDGCLGIYNNLEKRDLISFNVLLDSLCRCGKIQKALLIFTQTSSTKAEAEKIIPDVITYSILIGELLKVGSKSAVSNVRKLYKDMKSNRDIMPDCGLIEM